MVERETRGLEEPETETRGLGLTVGLGVVLREGAVVLDTRGDLEAVVETEAQPLTRALLLLLRLRLGEVEEVLLCRGERDRESVAVWLLLCVLELVATWQRVGLGETRGVAEVEGQPLELRVPLWEPVLLLKAEAEPGAEGEMEGLPVTLLQAEEVALPVRVRSGLLVALGLTERLWLALPVPLLLAVGVEELLAPPLALPLPVGVTLAVLLGVGAPLPLPQALVLAVRVPLLQVLALGQ